MTVPISNIDFYSDAVIQDPYPVYAELRDLGPVVYLEKTICILLHATRKLARSCCNHYALFRRAVYHR